MVKVGDRIRILENNAFSTDAKKGDIFLVGEANENGCVRVSGPKPFFFYPEHYELVIEPPPPTYSIPADTETVTLKYADGSTQDIDVKDRARGVPEWVKDGAWVVHKENGELHQLIEGEPGYFKAVNKKTWHPFVLDFHPSMTVSDVFRPFTNSDWKWGMWAEYRGEKVFVMNGIDKSGYVEISGKPIHHNTLDGWNIAKPSELTPTTAP